MASSDVWSDYEQIRHSIRMNTVDKLKQMIHGLNEECRQQLAKSGKKQEIIDRIVNLLDSWRSSRMEDQYIKARNVIMQVRSKGFYNSNRAPAHPVLPSPTSVQSYSPMVKPVNYSGHPSAGSGTLPRYNPYALPRRPTAGSSSYGVKPNIQFKDSPFYSIKEVISGVVECPESIGPSDRRTAGFDFTLNSEQVSKITAPGSKSQVLLFCTSSIFYAGNSSYTASNLPCPIEFPPTCEVRVNNATLPANLKGLKKKPGTAPPPDIGKQLNVTGSNRVDMVYLNTQSQQGVPPKKYYLAVMLVETTSVSELVNDLKESKYKSSQEIRQQMVQSTTEDDDIVAGPQKMSLKCPLSFTHINIPTRSSKCVHSQCFDATSWFSVMEQTTTWLCPVCERVLDCKELIVDGYFAEILSLTPDSVEDVIVEPDGEWHTADNKFASTGWKASHPPASALMRSPRKIVKSEEASPKLGNDDEQAKADQIEVVVLDTDDEDEGRVKRELSPTHTSPARQSYASIPRTHTETSLSQQSDVIDLTGDSDDDDDDDDDEQPLATQNGKRRAAEADISSDSPTEQIWKKGRFDHDRALAAAVLSPPSTQVHGGEHPPSLPPRPIRTNNLAPLLSYPPYPSYPPYHSRGTSGNTAPPLPSLPNSFLPGRPPTDSTRW
ncbi:hypothetical protein AX17_000703 [Amanita inopinata Kibby_2008]|nr:hypothetical protein AX17_000703 [Amanita inopinata Kibby_2008]